MSKRSFWLIAALSLADMTGAGSLGWDVWAAQVAQAPILASIWIAISLAAGALGLIGGKVVWDKRDWFGT